MIVLSASFGLFVTSLLKDTRQSGIVYGGVLTMMGMVGMISIFTGQVPGATTGALDIVSLLVPQGWTVRAWQILQAGGGLGDVLVTLLVMLGLAAIFFAVGLLRFRKRFA
jgi:ABC-type multidrug transport system permease subunit